MILRAVPQIIIIDDKIKDDNTYPLVDMLKIEYGAENIHLFQEPNEGIRFIRENLSKKMIVLLDIMFGGMPEGLRVFDTILAESKMVCFILMSGQPEKVSTDKMMELINGHAWYFVKRDRPAKVIMKLIKDAAHNLATRIDGALEEWILRHNTFKREQPYIKLQNGKTLSLNDVLQEIRLDTEFGREMQKNILSIAITKLQKDAEKLDN